MRRLIIISIYCLFCTKLIAQDQIVKEREKIDSLFSTEFSRQHLKDTITLYMFAFKVNVAKDKKGKIKVLSINTSDSSSFKLYKDLKFLKDINYNLIYGVKG